MDGIETYRAGGKTVRVITDRAVFSRFRRRWDAALKEYPMASIYVSHQWLDAMWEAYGDEIHGRVVVIDDAMGPCALAPMMGLRYRYRGLSIPAVGPLDHMRSSRSDIPLIRDHAICVELLRNYTKNWGASLWHLDRFPEKSEIFQLLVSDWDTARRIEHYENPVAAIVDTSTSWQEYLEGKSRNFRRDCRDIQNNLDGIEMHVTGEAGSVGDLLRYAADRGWTGQGGTDFTLDPRREHFLNRVIADGEANGALHAVLAYDGDQPVGFTFGIAFNGTLYAIESACARGYEKRSVDTGTLAELIWLAFESPELRACDMDTIRSQADERRRWATHLEQQVNALVMNGGVGSAAIRAGRKLGVLKKALIPSRKPLDLAGENEAA